MGWNQRPFLIITQSARDSGLASAMTVAEPVYSPSTALPEPGSSRRSHLFGVPALFASDVSNPSGALPPGQCRIDGDSHHAAVIAAPMTSYSPAAELTSGPHLRAVVLVVFALLWLVSREWAPQLALFPFVLLCTTSTSALWCLPHEVVLSLGPVPICLFRRRIPYSRIASITVVQGRLRVLCALVRRGLRLWQPLGIAYGLTFGKALINIVLRADSDRSAQWSLRDCSQQPLLISVDDAEDVLAYVLFRQEHGAEAPLPTSLISHPPEVQARWVWCDVFDILLRWHARNQTACDICGLFLQPFQSDTWGSHARIA